MHGDAARVLQVAQPVLGRVGLGREGQLVDEALVGEGVLDAARGLRRCALRKKAFSTCAC
jgi:hypothetical protein